MPPFPWDSLKEDTLRRICEDLQANLGTQQKREDMVAFLKLRYTGSAAEPTNLQIYAESTCPCAAGWLSPRMRFILSTVAIVASDIILDTGRTAIQMGEGIESVYMTSFIPEEALQVRHGRLAAWIKGFSLIFRVIHMLFESRQIPTMGTLLETLSRLKESERELVNAYAQYSDIKYALSGLVQRAEEEWEEDFEETHCDRDSEWRRLPACARHDFDWTMVKDMLAE